MWSMASLARSKYPKVHLFTLATLSVNTSCLKQRRNRTGIIHAIILSPCYGLYTLVTFRLYSRLEKYFHSWELSLQVTIVFDCHLIPLIWNRFGVKNGYFDKARHPELEGYDQILNLGNMRLLSHGDELGMAHIR